MGQLYNLDFIPDYDRFLIDTFTLSPETKVDEDGKVVNPRFKDGVYVGGDFFTPEESLARMKAGHGKTWPNGVDKPAVEDPISVYAHGWINFQRGYHPLTGVSISKQSLQGQPTPISEQPWAIGDGSFKVVPPDVQAINDKLDAILEKLTPPSTPTE